MEYPEIGKLVYARKRVFQILNVEEFKRNLISPVHFLLTLEDIETGEKLRIIHRSENQIEPEIKFYDPNNIEDIISHGIEDERIFDSFVTAAKWSTNSIDDQEKKIVKAPFYSSARLYSFQLEPLVRALSMSRISLLIADDVGLGKTIEAGMIIQELILRGKISRIIIVCPASLQLQWQREMEEKFSLEFNIMNLKEISRLKREYGANVNPWNVYPRIITSIDFIKQEQHLEAFENSAVDWDMLIVDEAHNVMPKPLKEYYRDSDRAKAIRRISLKVKHRIFLTATPHVGKTEAFTAFLEMIDPLHFSRGKSELSLYERGRLKKIMVRRLKRDIERAVDVDFKKRYVEAISVTMREEEKKLIELLDNYALSIQNSREYKQLSDSKKKAVDFGLVIMKKRLLSSAYAFYKTVERKLISIVNMLSDEEQDKFLEYMLNKLNNDYENDIDKDEDEKELLNGIKRFIPESSLQLLYEMREIARRIKDKEDDKITKIYQFIDEKLKTGDDWNEEKLIIFTEYKDTLDYIYKHLKKRYGDDRITILYGGMSSDDREKVKLDFETHPKDGTVRILVATDVASEGINLQSYCRYLIHYEIPWSPIKLEQRNGRIHRMGQKRDVYIYHFVYKNNEDHEVLWLMVQKVETIRKDIKDINEILAQEAFEIEKRLFIKDKEVIEGMFEKVGIEAEKESLEVMERIRKEIIESIKEAQEKYSITSDKKRAVFENALRINGGILKEYPNMEDAYFVAKLPKSWKDLEKYTKNDHTFIPLSFAEPSEDENVLYLHLGHPLMKKAIQFFKSNIWKFDSTLRKFSVVITGNVMKDILVRTYCKAIITDNKLFKISDDVIEIDFLLNNGKLVHDYTDIEVIRNADECVVSNIRRKLTKLIQTGKVKDILQKSFEDYLTRVENVWIKKREKEIAQYKQLMSIRINEIDKSISNLKKRYSKLKKLSSENLYLFNDKEKKIVSDELEQIEEDINYLKKRKDEIKTEIFNIIDELKSRTIRSTSAFVPFAVRVFVPKGVIVCK